MEGKPASALQLYFEAKRQEPGLTLKEFRRREKEKPEGLTPGQQATGEYRTRQAGIRARERARDEIDDLLNDAAGPFGGEPAPEVIMRMAEQRGIDLAELYKLAGREIPPAFAGDAASTGEEETMPDDSVWRKTSRGRVRVR